MTRAFLFWLILNAACSAETRRVVVLKIDGVPAELVDQLIDEHKLPWIERIFSKQGTRVANFYVRGVSLSAPSWAMLDTGQHQRIHGNVEYDRLTLRPYDYLNFFPFYLNSAAGKRADMPGVEVLDASGVPLVIDRFPWQNRYQNFQLYQRWIRWNTLKQSLPNRFANHSLQELFDEWQTGFEFNSFIYKQIERELLQRIADDKDYYLDYYSGAFDHIAHATNSRTSQVAELQALDNLVSRVWEAIQKSSLAARTSLVIVSDHGMNSVPQIYSQGYSLLDWFRSEAGGGHHTATNRHPLDQFKMRGLNPMVAEVITPSHDSTYLKDEAQQYPTAFLDLDGNERAAVQLRNSDLNELHILLKQIQRKDLRAQLRRECVDAFLELRDARREDWKSNLTELQEELQALRSEIERLRPQVKAESKRKYTEAEFEDGQNQAPRRRVAQLRNWEQDEALYTDYVRVMGKLLELSRTELEARNWNVEDLIPKRSLGPRNTLGDLQSYVVGLSREGLVSAKSGTGLDVLESFRHVNYPAALMKISVRNNVQKDVGPRPLDFIAMRTNAGVRLYIDEEHQATVESREQEPGKLELRYVPVGGWRPGLPLKLYEDPALRVPQDWLNGWHTDREWLQATYAAQYANSVVAIHEQFVAPAPLAGVSEILKRYEARRRALVLPDLLLFAANHWNFNVRGFNPGGNHGSFFQPSMHSVLMFAGGVPAGLVVREPYDSLSFAPTLLRLAGIDCAELPGPLIQEVVPQTAPILH